jgi:hypothetical protein
MGGASIPRRDGPRHIGSGIVTGLAGLGLLFWLAAIVNGYCSCYTRAMAQTQRGLIGLDPDGIMLELSQRASAGSRKT